MIFNEKILFSVITPTYNRAEKLKDCFLGLQKQSFSNFEWLIIDDGSIDKTKSLVDKWKDKLNIKYYYQENSGKPSAVNKGIINAKGKYFTVLDSDDIPVPDALRKLYSLLEESSAMTIAVGCLTKDKNNNIIGSNFPKDVWSSSILEAYSTFNIKGDKWLSFKLGMAKNFLYPIYENEKLVPEGLVFNRMARAGYKVDFINSPLLIHEYGEDGITKNINKIKKENPIGFLSYYFENIISDDLIINRYYIKNTAALMHLVVENSAKKIKVFILIIISLPIIIIKRIYNKIKL
jgi:glycosyltransferase involved in cell wall biosynthesis